MTATPGTPAAPWNALAIIALVLAFSVPPGGIVCGVIARRQIRSTGEQGDGVALSGMIVGTVFTALIVLFLVLWFAVLATSLLGFLAVFAHIGAASGV